MRHIDSIFLLAVTLLLILKSNAQLPGTWPELDKPPQYVSKFDGLVDFTKVSNAPVKKSAEDCSQDNNFCDWSCTSCTRDGDVVECPTKGDWGLSFDDGPVEYTDTVLDYLASQDIRVTFFVVGSRVVESPEILVKAVKAGHQIGVHTWSHTALTTQTNEEIVAEMQWTADAIKAAANITPTYMRPPYGDYDDRVRNIVTQLGYKPTIWDKDTNDWLSGSDPTFQMSWVEGNFSQWVKEPSTTGHISLEHDLYKQTAEQALKVVPILQTAGFDIKPIAVCRSDNRPYVENVSLNYTIGNNSSSVRPEATDGLSIATTTSSSLPLTKSINGPSSKTGVTSATSNASNAKNNLSFSLIIITLINSYLISRTCIL